MTQLKCTHFTMKLGKLRPFSKTVKATTDWIRGETWSSIREKSHITNIIDKSCCCLKDTIKANLKLTFKECVCAEKKLGSRAKKDATSYLYGNLQTVALVAHWCHYLLHSSWLLVAVAHTNDHTLPGIDTWGCKIFDNVIRLSQAVCGCSIVTLREPLSLHDKTANIKQQSQIFKQFPFMSQP